MNKVLCKLNIKDDTKDKFELNRKYLKDNLQDKKNYKNKEKGDKINKSFLKRMCILDKKDDKVDRWKMNLLIKKKSSLKDN
jgi:predicted phage gp36 major capsid-like protein